MGDFNNLISKLSKEVVEILLEEELTDHLGFEKYDYKNKTIDNSRNGSSSKRVKSKFGNIDLSIPRDRKLRKARELRKLKWMNSNISKEMVK